MQAPRARTMPLAIVGVIASIFSLWAIVGAGREAVAVGRRPAMPRRSGVFPGPPATRGSRHDVVEIAVAVAVGGMLGCVLRWVLAMFLNRYFPTVPPGTLAANLIGCYIIGIALAFFTQYPGLRARMAAVRHHGILRRLDHLLDLFGGSRSSHAIGTHGRAHCSPIAVHLVGSLLMTFAGIATVTWLKSLSLRGRARSADGGSTGTAQALELTHQPRTGCQGTHGGAGLLFDLDHQQMGETGLLEHPEQIARRVQSPRFSQSRPRTVPGRHDVGDADVLMDGCSSTTAGTASASRPGCRTR